MKPWLALGTLISALAMYQTADAATLRYSDFDLISVVPRSPSIKPLVMPIPARELNKRLASEGVKISRTGR